MVRNWEINFKNPDYVDFSVKLYEKPTHTCLMLTIMTH